MNAIEAGTRDGAVGARGVFCPRNCDCRQSHAHDFSDGAVPAPYVEQRRSCGGSDGCEPLAKYRGAAPMHQSPVRLAYQFDASAIVHNLRYRFHG